MNCDDQIRVVNRDDHAHALAPNVSHVASLAVRRDIDFNRIFDHAPASAIVALIFRAPFFACLLNRT